MMSLAPVIYPYVNHVTGINICVGNEVGVSDMLRALGSQTHTLQQQQLYSVGRRYHTFTVCGAHVSLIYGVSWTRSCVPGGAKGI